MTKLIKPLENMLNLVDDDDHSWVIEARAALAKERGQLSQILLYESLMLSAVNLLESEGYTTLCKQLLDAMEHYKT